MSSIKENAIDSTVKAKASRLAFGEALAELGEKHTQIVALDADLSKSTRTDLFAKKFPNRFFEMGICEMNMIGAAAGMALGGKIPYAASFACFLTGRFDQIRMSVSFTGANVRLVGTHAGVGIGEDGHSQMGLEDLALMRSLPNMTVFQPADERDTRDFMAWSVLHQGPCYVRLTRQNLPALKRASDYAFAPGRWHWLSDMPGSGGVVLLATGGVMAPTLDAADLLQKAGLNVSVVNANWIKPLDEKSLTRLLGANLSAVATVEDHYTVGGLGGAVAEFLSARAGAPRLLRLGVESFGQSGTPEATYEHFGFTGPKLAQKIQAFLR